MSTFNKKLLDFKNGKISEIGQCPSTYLLSFVELASWAELERQGGLSYQKIKKITFVGIEKLSFWQSPIKIRDVVGTPILHGIYVFSKSAGIIKKRFSTSPSLLYSEQESH